MGIDEIRRKKMNELANNENEEFAKQLEDQQKQLHQLQQQLSLIESVAKQFMSQEAISRYGAVKMAHPDTAVKAIALVAQAVQLGQLKEKLSDADFKEILNAVKEGKMKFNLKK